jgi:hypothetical protein
MAWPSSPLASPYPEPSSSRADTATGAILHPGPRFEDRRSKLALVMVGERLPWRTGSTGPRDRGATQ